MLIEGLAVRTVSNVGGPDPAGIARDMLAAHRGLGGVDVPALRDAVAQLAKEQPDLGEAVRREVASRLSVTDQAVFERTPASKPLVVDDHRPASSLSELDSWEAGYRQAIKENGGPFSNSPQLEAAFAADRQRLEANTAKADAETSKLLFVGLGAPMAAGAGAAAAPIAGTAVGGQFVSGLGGRIAYYTTSGAIGGTTNVGLEFAKNGVFDMNGTTGAYVGAAMGGALGGTGAKFFGSQAPKFVNNATLGGVAGTFGEITAQSINMASGAAKSANGADIASAGVIGATAGAITPLEVRVGGLNSGRNNSVAIFEGLQTRIGNGHISQHQLRYSVEAGAGQATTGTAQGVLGATATGIYQKATR